MPTQPKEFRYTVRGHWPFPLDMLRQNGSRAASEADQALIDKLSAEHTEDRSYFEDVDINLVGLWKQNTARWESFGWTVPSDTEHAFYIAAKEEARKRQQLIDSAMAKLTPEERAALQAEQPA